MPSNLNALIRYKQIDKSLRNPYVNCTIERLRTVCSDALKEFRGRENMVSERTIRDDIRVMRSEILDFNAPIVFENGKYFYSENDYSIFNISIKQMELLKDVFHTIKDNVENNKKTKQLEELLVKISPIIGEQYKPKKKSQSSSDGIHYSMPPSRNAYQITTDKHGRRVFIPDSNDYLKWDEVLSIL
jgi:hypothetical protein